MEKHVKCECGMYMLPDPEALTIECFDCLVKRSDNFSPENFTKYVCIKCGKYSKKYSNEAGGVLCFNCFYTMQMTALSGMAEELSKRATPK